MVKFCSNCGAENENLANFCIRCGTTFCNNSKESNKNNLVKAKDKKLKECRLMSISLCPFCKKQTLNHFNKKSFFTNKKNYICYSCGLNFEKKGSKYKLINISNKNLEMWKRYNGQILTKEEWIRIFDGGLSNHDQEKLDEEIAKKEQMELINQKNKDIAFFVNSLATSTEPFQIVQNSPIILKKGEIVFLVLEQITLMEPRAVRTSTGVYGGPTVRVAKGISFRVGSTRAQSESHDELRNIDVGKLIISNKRFIFIGSKKNVNVNLTKIVSITEYKDGISLQRENKQKMEYFVGTDNTNCSFTVDGRRQSTPFYGYMLKALIQGRISLLE